MTGKSIGYIRVSTTEQNTDRQLEGIKLDKRFVDKMSGRTTDRPNLQACLDYLREGDTLHVHSIDRLARSLRDLLAIVSDLLERRISVVFVKDGLHFTADKNNAQSVLMLSMLGAVATFELSLIKERQSEGIAKAKARGAYTGRKPVITDELKKQVQVLLAEGVPKSQIAERLGVSRATVYNSLKV